MPALVIVALFLGVSTMPSHAQDKKQLKKKLQTTYKAGAKAGNEGNYETAAAKFEEALTYAKKLELGDIQTKIQNNLVSSLKSAAGQDVKKKNYAKSLTHYKKVLEYTADDPDPGVYHNQGIALLAVDSTTAGLQSLQKAIDIGQKTGNTKVANLATERIRSEFVARASKALRNKTPQAALSALDEMRNYVDPSAKSLFYRASALYEQKSYADAISTAEEGLGLHQGSRSDAAKYHFVIAESNMKLGNKASACKTFEKAAFGDYKTNAEHYLKNDCK